MPPSANIQEINPEWTPDRLPTALFDTPYFFLLDSSLSGTHGRWSIAGWSPRRIVRSDQTADLFGELRKELKEHRRESDDFPFVGGWIGYLGYEYYSQLENTVPPRSSDLMPEALFGFYENFYLYDHEKKRAYRSAEGGPGVDPFHLPPSPSLLRRGSEGAVVQVTSNFTKEQYLSAVNKIKGYIASGDCYQVNLAQRFIFPTTKSAPQLYQQLRTTSPAPFAAYLNLGDLQILSSSPECFFTLTGRKVTTRPIKGTRPRGTDRTEDARLKEALITSPKDRAELLMITDLMRNDLGRVCEAGSVSVSRLAEVESYAQVHHLVSTVCGKLAERRDVFDLLRALFPGGSITGAPKIRAMQIIRELETAPRNVYTGSVGFLSRNGHAEFNIAIRTLLLKAGTATFWGGGGIVADSDPEAEYQETLTKISGIKQALLGG